MGVHHLDQRFAHRVGDFQQDVAVALGLDQLPHHQPVFQRQGFQDIGHVGGVQLVELFLQGAQVLLVHQRFHQGMLGHILFVDEVFHQTVAMQQSQHLLEAALQTILRFLSIERVHARILSPAPGVTGMVRMR